MFATLKPCYYDENMETSIFLIDYTKAIIKYLKNILIVLIYNNIFFK